MLSFKDLNKLYGTIYINSQMYLSNWKQKDFGVFQKKFSNIFNVYNAKKLSKVNVDKKKIKIGFLSPDLNKSHSITYFIKDLIKDLKQTKFETHGLSLLKSREHDETTEKLIPLFDYWTVLGEKTFKTITSITPNANTSSSITVGFTGVGITTTGVTGSATLNTSTMVADVTNDIFSMSTGDAAGLKVQYSGLGADASVYYGESSVDRLTFYIDDILMAYALSIYHQK